MDSADLLFSDLTDWSVVEPNGFPDYRYNDKEIIRAYADKAAPTFECLVAHGVIFVDKAPDNAGANVNGKLGSAGKPRGRRWRGPRCKPACRCDRSRQPPRSSGIGLIRPLEVAARKAGVQILLQHRMTGLVREEASFRPSAGNRATIRASR